MQGPAAGRDAVAVDLCVLLRAGEALGPGRPGAGPVERGLASLLGGLASALWSELDFEGEGERQECSGATCMR